MVILTLFRIVIHSPPRVNFEFVKMEKTPARFIWHYVKIFKWSFLLIGFLVVVRQITEAISPWYLAKIYETVSAAPEGGMPWQQLYVYAFRLAAVMLAGMLVAESAMFIIARFMPKMRTMVIKDTFEDVNRQSISFFSREMTGNISGKVQLLSNNTIELTGFSHEIFYMVSNLLVKTVVLSWISWYYTVLMAFWTAAIVLISRKLGKTRRQLGIETGRQTSAANGTIVDALANYSEIKSFANFNFEKINLLKTLRQLRRAESKERFVMGIIRMIQQTVTVASGVGFLFFSIYMLKKDIIDVTDFIYANTLFMTVSHLAFSLSWSYNNISRIFGNITSALETLAVDPEITDAPKARNLKIRKAGIRFENVTFGYDTRDPLFKNLSLEIAPQEKVGLVGLSGSGKSTFVKLISRYYDVNDGRITINGFDIRGVTQNSLHKNISVIPQDVCLFNRTLMENIRYGDTDAGEEKVVAAAKKACADNFIRSFPDGYQTKVGDRGVILSGGERQRIAIARAILKNAPILIFDEATSALDSQSERHIQKSLSNLMKGKTVLAIAHRLSTLREMDRILVFDKGRIIESGSHEELLTKKGLYFKLYNMQADGFVGS